MGKLHVPNIVSRLALRSEPPRTLYTIFEGKRAREGHRRRQQHFDRLSSCCAVGLLYGKNQVRIVINVVCSYTLLREDGSALVLHASLHMLLRSVRRRFLGCSPNESEELIVCRGRAAIQHPRLVRFCLGGMPYKSICPRSAFVQDYATVTPSASIVRVPASHMTVDKQVCSEPALTSARIDATYNDGGLNELSVRCGDERERLAANPATASFWKRHTNEAAFPNATHARKISRIPSMTSPRTALRRGAGRPSSPPRASGPLSWASTATISDLLPAVKGCSYRSFRTAS